MNFNRTQEVLEEALLEQFEFLRASCERYDAGNFAEAKRLATTVYVIVHDGKGRIKSLLGQLGLKNKLEFVNSSRGILPNFWPKMPLTLMRGEPTGVTFIPRCFDNTPNEFLHKSNFRNWYEEPIFQDSSGPVLDSRQLRAALSRKNMIHFLRSQDGGAHFDETITNAAYYNLSVNRDTGFRGGLAGEECKPIPNGHFATMRQIAWEVEHTLLTID